MEAATIRATRGFERGVTWGRSPLHGRLVVRFPGWRYFVVFSDWYAAGDNLGRAVAWGQLLFGGGSYAIFEGPRGLRNRFLASRRHARRGQTLKPDETRRLDVGRRPGVVHRTCRASS